MDFLRDPIWQFVGVIVTIVLAATPFFYRWLRKRQNKQGEFGSGATSTNIPVPKLPSTKALKQVSKTANLHDIKRFLDVNYDDPGIDALCLEYFPQVYDRFSQGMRKDSKITLLIDYCRRSKSRLNTLVSLLHSKNND